MFKWLKLSHHSHSGKLRAHEHTSYVPLCFLLLVTGLALTGYSVAAAPSPGPGSGSIGLSGSMPGKPPTIAAVIESPRNLQRFSESPVTFSGTCPAGTLVELFKNDIFAGSTPCDEHGKFSIDIDLLIGQNIVFAKVYDSLNQPGPDSNKVTVFYDALPAQAGSLDPLNLDGTQLLLNTEAVFRGMFPEEEFSIPIDVLGGAPPYAINIQWGDTSNKVVPRSSNATFKANHIYQKAGNYRITLQATDAKDRVAFLTVAAIVNGQPNTAASTPVKTEATPNQLLLLWPLYTGAFAMVVSFWLGEIREKRVLAKRGLLLPPRA